MRPALRAVLHSSEACVYVGQQLMTCWPSLSASFTVAELGATEGSAGDEGGEGDGVGRLLPPPGLYVLPTGSPPLRIRLWIGPSVHALLAQLPK